MKKKHIPYYLLALLCVLVSCSSDNDAGTSTLDPKPTQYTVTDLTQDPWIVNFEYTGNLISRITLEDGTITYNYEAGRLISFERVRFGWPSQISRLTYEDDRLTELKVYLEWDLENHIESTRYFYNSSGQINKTIGDDGSGFIFTTFYFYDSSGNVIQSEFNGSKTRYLYDTKNSAFRNVFPQLDSGVTWEWLGSQVNNQIEIQRRSSTDTDFTTRFYYEYDYNENNYPIQRRQVALDGTVWVTVDYLY